MGRYLLILTGIVGSFFLVVYRETVGDLIGEADWMKKVGGVHNFILILALFLFFWSLAELTGTAEFLFSPLTRLFPSLRVTAPPAF